MFKYIKDVKVGDVISFSQYMDPFVVNKILATRSGYIFFSEDDTPIKKEFSPTDKCTIYPDGMPSSVVLSPVDYSIKDNADYQKGYAAAKKTFTAVVEGKPIDTEAELGSGLYNINNRFMYNLGRNAALRDAKKGYLKEYFAKGIPENLKGVIVKKSQKGESPDGSEKFENTEVTYTSMAEGPYKKITGSIPPHMMNAISRYQTYSDNEMAGMPQDNVRKNEAIKNTKKGCEDGELKDLDSIKDNKGSRLVNFRNNIHSSNNFENYDDDPDADTDSSQVSKPEYNLHGSGIALENINKPLKRTLRAMGVYGKKTIDNSRLPVISDLVDGLNRRLS